MSTPLVSPLIELLKPTVKLKADFKNWFIPIYGNETFLKFLNTNTEEQVGYLFLYLQERNLGIVATKYTAQVYVIDSTVFDKLDKSFTLPVIDGTYYVFCKHIQEFYLKNLLKSLGEAIAFLENYIL